MNETTQQSRRQLVNELAQVAQSFSQTEQLKARLLQVVERHMEASVETKKKPPYCACNGWGLRFMLFLYC